MCGPPRGGLRMARDVDVESIEPGYCTHRHAYERAGVAAPQLAQRGGIGGRVLVATWTWNRR